MAPKYELDQLVNSICKSTRDTDASKILKEIEDNNSYITEVQLKRLLKLHDGSFRESLTPLQKLHDKYNEIVMRQGDLQSWAELIDRDLRVLELTMQLAKRR
ncbi:hypothetical protein ZYGR_0H03900 [Zygosaccharomyces rouxii]|uniref:Biogenesis of lysosome-related organelles complex 1 subunit BLS1 n=2 Tax=Zygosaccharomyces rouxii TaxID=4956 RepID=BL1S1_ZYGRC|nr:uncharacterized protein ZYRO0B12936g [Zygosaccharomyces rouxii]C5DS11.1 RecName: Full=Biogenesis of lysosome-related organelles complex 1 subunit BLS1; Short=BLOC-1 subunit BLS1; AltName: Full=BLOS1-homolog [Zygosaccharomyces rouxii CBS 732]KAH9199899.1 biogenesis of lysosome-related organelles complex 1 subunit BLS1 [Zygosaccharomyces rouxii]GAV47544.1 hypothetical protein ZYGR_0H03900 [Zygosaccharomyces rouxii]CAR26572.1 ZYRO0B12936p [Zygosaccharomyces rouxii]